MTNRLPSAPSKIGDLCAHLRSLKVYVPGAQPAPGAVKLNANENLFPPSPRVIAALAEISSPVFLRCGIVVALRRARPLVGTNPVWEQGSHPFGHQPEQLLGPATNPHDIDRSFTMPQIIVGCDLSRAFIDVCINAGRMTSRIENTQSGITEWMRHPMSTLLWSSRPPTDVTS